MVKLGEFNEKKLVETNCDIFFEKRLSSDELNKKEPSLYG
jgi:hypothetical protein